MPNTAITGKITRAGTALAGFLVRAFDQEYLTVLNIETPTLATLLGEAHTDNEGNYRISYRANAYLDAEDRVRVSGRFEVPRYEPQNPDLFIEVWDGPVKLGTSSVSRDVSADSHTIDMDLPAGGGADRTDAEQIGDAIVAAGSTVASDVAGAVDAGATFVAGLVAGLPGGGPVTGAVSSGILGVGGAVADVIRGGANVVSNAWNSQTHNPTPIPEDLWQDIATRYAIYKRGLLLRHFFPPRAGTDRYVPYLLTEMVYLGYTRDVSHPAPACDPGDRWGPSERADYDVERNAAEYAAYESKWSVPRFAEHLDLYARTYENGLAYTGAFIGAIAYEHSLLPETAASDRDDCERLIALALDAIEDLEQRSGLSGYILRYHEHGEARARGTDGRLRSCGFQQDGDTILYCRPLDMERPPAHALEIPKELGRQRKAEPSGDEYTWLIEGLAVIYHVMPATSESRTRAASMLARIDRYFVEHFFQIVRPCGNFAWRGPFTSYFEYPWRALTWNMFFAAQRDSNAPTVSRNTGNQLWEKAVLQSSAEIFTDAPADLVRAENVRQKTEPDERFLAYNLVANVAQPGRRTGPASWEAIPVTRPDGKTVDIPAPMPVWTLWMLAKAANLGRWVPSARPTLETAFNSWFDTGNLPHTIHWKLSGNSWNLQTLAVAIALTQKRSPVIWDTLRLALTDDFFPGTTLQFRDQGNSSARPIVEDGQQAASFTWAAMTIAHALGKPIGLSLASATAPGPLPDPNTLDASGNEPRGQGPRTTLRDLLDREWHRRQQRLESRDGTRPVFVLGAGPQFPGASPPSLADTPLFRALEAERVELAFVIEPVGDDLLALATSVGSQIASRMAELESRLAGAEFDLVTYSTGGLIARALMLLVPSALRVYWPANVVMLGSPGTGPGRAFPDGDPRAAVTAWIRAQDAARRFEPKPHHPDTTFYTGSGAITGGGDGYAGLSDGALRPRDAARIGWSPYRFDGVAHAPEYGSTWYFDADEVRDKVIEWIGTRGQPVRSVVRIDPSTFNQPRTTRTTTRVAEARRRREARLKAFRDGLAAAPGRRRPERPEEPPVRFVINTRLRMPIDEVRAHVRAQLGDRARVRAMFRGADSADDPNELTHYYVATIPHLLESDLDRDPWDIAYGVRDKVPAFASVEPDSGHGVFNASSGDSSTKNCRGPREDAPADLGWAPRMVRVEEAWAMSPSGREKGRGIRIGHPDTGWAEHVELQSGQIDELSSRSVLDDSDDAHDRFNSRPIDEPGHGTATGSALVSRGHVEAPPASGMGGTGAPGRITGVAPEATLVSIRCANGVVRIFDGLLAEAIDHAIATDCHVISISLGGAGFQGLDVAVREACRKNLILVAAAGNCVPWVVAPANYAECIAAAGVTPAGKPWKGSASGANVTISAPAQYVWRAERISLETPTNEIFPGQGTSFAAPHVAGVAALWLAHHGRESLIARYRGKAVLQEVYTEVLRRATVAPDGWNTRKYGVGIIDAAAVLAEPLPPPDFKSLPDPARAVTGAINGLRYSQQPPTRLQRLERFFSALSPAEVRRRLAGLLLVSEDQVAEYAELWGAELLELAMTHREVHRAFVADVADAAATVERTAEAVADYASETLKEVVGWVGSAR